MSREAKPGQPYPHDVWLTVRFDGIPGAKREGVRERLRQLSGFNSGLTGSDGGLLRYDYSPGRAESIPRRARQILSHAGATNPDVSSFVLWRLDLSFRGPLHVNVYAPLIEGIEGIPEVLDAHDLGNSLAGVYVQFRGEPTGQALQRIRSLVAPHMAAA